MNLFYKPQCNSTWLATSGPTDARAAGACQICPVGVAGLGVGVGVGVALGEFFFGKMNTPTTIATTIKTSSKMLPSSRKSVRPPRFLTGMPPGGGYPGPCGPPGGPYCGPPGGAKPGPAIGGPPGPPNGAEPGPPGGGNPPPGGPNCGSPDGGKTGPWPGGAPKGAAPGGGNPPAGGAPAGESKPRMPPCGGGKFGPAGGPPGGGPN
jgi:hypothetical protein